MDTFVVIDGLPEVNEEQKPKLVKFLLKKLNQVGKTKEDMVEMPMGPDGKSMKCVILFTRFELLRGVSSVTLTGHCSADLRLWNIPPLQRPPPPSDNSIWSPSTRSTPLESTS